MEGGTVRRQRKRVALLGPSIVLLAARMLPVVVGHVEHVTVCIVVDRADGSRLAASIVIAAVALGRAWLHRKFGPCRLCLQRDRRLVSVGVRVGAARVVLRGSLADLAAYVGSVEMFVFRFFALGRILTGVVTWSSSA